MRRLSLRTPGMRPFLALCVLFSVSVVFASDVRHRVKSGDTLPGLARYYYGDEKKALYIIKANSSLDPKKSLKPGKSIIIPFVTVYTVKNKGTFKDLASRYLKDPKKGGALAVLNGMEEKKVLTRGTVVKIPFQVFHRVEPGETLASIADRYLGGEKDAVFLKDYNRLKALGDITPGKLLAIPLMVERITPPRETVNPPPPPRVKVKKPDPSLYRKDLDEAIAQYEEGEYKASIDKLAGITLRVGKDSIFKKDLIKIHLYMAFGYIALDETMAARREFLEVLKLNPKFRLPREDTSPKILAVFNEVKP